MCSNILVDLYRDLENEMDIVVHLVLHLECFIDAVVPPCGKAVIFGVLQV